MVVYFVLVVQCMTIVVFERRRGSSKIMTRVSLNTPAVFLNTYRKYLFKFKTVASGFYRGP